MQINVDSKTVPQKDFSKPVWFRRRFNGDPVWYFVARVAQSVFDSKLVIDLTSWSYPNNRIGPNYPDPEGIGFTIYVDGQDNMNHDVDERLEEYIQEYVHGVYPNVDIWIVTHNSFAIGSSWTYEELWSHYNFFGHGLNADIDPNNLENIRLGNFD